MAPGDIREFWFDTVSSLYVCMCIRWNEDKRSLLLWMFSSQDLVWSFTVQCKQNIHKFNNWNILKLQCLTCYCICTNRIMKYFLRNATAIVIFHLYDTSVTRQYMYLLFAFMSTACTLSAFNLDSLQASVASGYEAEVKDDLFLGGFNGTVIACSTLLSGLTSSHRVYPSKVHQRSISPWQYPYIFIYHESVMISAFTVQQSLLLIQEIMFYFPHGVERRNFILIQTLSYWSKKHTKV